MSTYALGLIMKYHPYKGAKQAAAVQLGDFANDNTGVINATVDEMAERATISARHFRRLLREMEDDGWIQCITRSAGGSGCACAYQINPDWLRLPLGFTFGTKNPDKNPDTSLTPCPGFEEKPGQGVRVSDQKTLTPCPGFLDTPSLFKSITPLTPQNSESAVPSVTAVVDEDLRLARWMFGLVLEVLPNSQPPNWKRWTRDIRMMTGKGHPHRELAELFKWANEDRTPHPGSDFCWAMNIRSPAKLWAHWDVLNLRRSAADPARPSAPAVDLLCSVCHERKWTLMQGKSGTRTCGPCFDLSQRIERQQVANDRAHQHTL